MERIFLRDVAGLKAGEIRDLDWDFFTESARVHHGVSDPLESYSLPVQEAARRYVALSNTGVRLIRSGTEEVEARTPARPESRHRP